MSPEIQNYGQFHSPIQRTESKSCPLRSLYGSEKKVNESTRIIFRNAGEAFQFGYTLIRDVKELVKLDEKQIGKSAEKAEKQNYKQWVQPHLKEVINYYHANSPYMYDLELNDLIIILNQLVQIKEIAEKYGDKETAKSVATAYKWVFRTYNDLLTVDKQLQKDKYTENINNKSLVELPEELYNIQNRMKTLVQTNQKFLEPGNKVNLKEIKKNRDEWLTLRRKEKILRKELNRSPSQIQERLVTRTKAIQTNIYLLKTDDKKTIHEIALRLNVINQLDPKIWGKHKNYFNIDSYIQHIGRLIKDDRNCEGMTENVIKTIKETLDKIELELNSINNNEKPDSSDDSTRLISLQKSLTERVNLLKDLHKENSLPGLDPYELSKHESDLKRLHNALQAKPFRFTNEIQQLAAETEKVHRKLENYYEKLDLETPQIQSHQKVNPEEGQSISRVSDENVEGLTRATPLIELDSLENLRKLTLENLDKEAPDHTSELIFLNTLIDRANELPIDPDNASQKKQIGDFVSKVENSINILTQAQTQTNATTEPSHEVIEAKSVNTQKIISENEQTAQFIEAEKPLRVTTKSTPPIPTPQKIVEINPAPETKRTLEQFHNALSTEQTLTPSTPSAPHQAEEVITTQKIVYDDNAADTVIEKQQQLLELFTLAENKSKKLKVIDGELVLVSRSMIAGEIGTSKDSKAAINLLHKTINGFFEVAKNERTSPEKAERICKDLKTLIIKLNEWDGDFYAWRKAVIENNGDITILTSTDNINDAMAAILIKSKQNTTSTNQTNKETTIQKPVHEFVINEPEDSNAIDNFLSSYRILYYEKEKSTADQRQSVKLFESLSTLYDTASSEKQRKILILTDKWLNNTDINENDYSKEEVFSVIESLLTKAMKSDNSEIKEIATNLNLRLNNLSTESVIESPIHESQTNNTDVREILEAIAKGPITHEKRQECLQILRSTITVMNLELLKKLKIEELSPQAEKCENRKAIGAQATKISYHTTQTILLKPNGEIRSFEEAQRLTGFYIELMNSLLFPDKGETINVAGAMAINSALSSSALVKAGLIDAISNPSKSNIEKSIKEQFEKCNKTLSSEFDYKNLRKFEVDKKNLIPFMGKFMTDFTFGSEKKSKLALEKIAELRMQVKPTIENIQKINLTDLSKNTNIEKQIVEIDISDTNKLETTFFNIAKIMKPEEQVISRNSSSRHY